MATVRLQLRRGTASQWTSSNPILAAGEMGVETDTRKVKIGDGTSTWTTLDYVAADVPAIGEIAQDAVNDAFVAGTGITKSYDDAGNTITVSVDTSVIATKAELAEVSQDSVNDAIVAGVGLDKVYDDNANTITLDIDSTVATLTGTQTLTNKTLTSPIINGATVGGDLIPTTDNAHDLGSSSKMWRDIYVGPGSLYVNGQKVLEDDSGNIVVRADADENLSLRTSGSGNIELDPTGTGSVLIKGSLLVEAGNNITSADGNAIKFGGAIKTDTISSKTENTDLSLSADGTGKIYLNDNAEVNGNFVVSGNLTINGTTTNLNTETLAVADNLIDLNSNVTTGAPSENAGIRIKRGDSPDVQIRWNESTDKWEVTSDGSTYSSIAGEEATAAALSSHENDTTNIHGIADTSILVTTTGTQTLTNKTLTSPAIDSPSLTGTPTAPTPAANTNTTQIATTAFVGTAIDNLIGGAPGALDTLNELAAAVNDDENFAGYVISELGALDVAVDLRLTQLNEHANATTNVHGISNITNLVYTSDDRLSNERVPQNDSVSTAKIIDSAVTTGKIANGSITSDKIVDGAVVSSKIFNSSVTTEKIDAFAVTTGKIADLAVTTAKINDEAVIEAKLGQSAVTTAKIENAAVTDIKLADGSVSSAKLGDSSVTTAKIENAAVTNIKLADGSVSSTKLGDSSVTAAKIDNGAVTDIKLAVSSIVTEKIANENITTAKIANSAVTTDKIDSVSVTEGKIADGAVTSAKIANGTIVDGDISASAAISQSKVADLTADFALKAPLASPTFTGTVSGVTATMVGLANVDNTSDANKPVSTATQTALDLKAPLASPTFTGTVTVAAAGVAFTDGTQTKAGVPSLTTIGTTIGGAYNLSTGGLALRDQLIPVSGAHAITVPTNATTAWPVGTTISFYQSAGADANFVEESGVTILKTPGLKLRATGSSASLTKVATDTWLLAGDLKA